MTYSDKYKLICTAYKLFDVPIYDSHSHRHHIKPKSVYPELKNDENNIIAVHPLVHAALHLLLTKAYLHGELDERFKNIIYSDVVSYINSKMSNTQLVFDEYIADSVFRHVVKHFILLKDEHSKIKEEQRQRTQIFITGTCKETLNCKVFQPNDRSCHSKQLSFDEIAELDADVFRSCYKNIEKFKIGWKGKFYEKAVKLERFIFKEMPKTIFSKMLIANKKHLTNLNNELNMLFDNSCVKRNDVLDSLDDNDVQRLLKELQT